MDQPPPYRLDIEGPDERGGADQRAGSLRGRPWIGIHFDCCGVYTRVYRNADGTMYHGRCPHCLRKIRLRVGTGGTDARFFVAE